MYTTRCPAGISRPSTPGPWCCTRRRACSTRGGALLSLLCLYLYTWNAWFLTHHHTITININRYGQALALLRRQNGDLNFLVDYDPGRFEAEGCRLLVEQVS